MAIKEIKISSNAVQNYKSGNGKNIPRFSFLGTSAESSYSLCKKAGKQPEINQCSVK